MDFVLKAEQVKSAPREVKEWIRAILWDELAMDSGPPQHPNGRAGEATLELCRILGDEVDQAAL